jgi:hypothetical protein
VRTWQGIWFTAAIAVFAWFVATELVWLLPASHEPGLVRPLVTGGIFGALMGGLLGLIEIGLLDADLLSQPIHWLEKTLQGLVLGAVLGAGAFALADTVFAASHYAPWARALQWVGAGAALGAVEGVKASSWKRAMTAIAGAAIGAILGSGCIGIAPYLVNHHEEALSILAVKGLSLAVFGGLLGLGMALSLTLSREASLTVLAAPLPKQLDQSFPVGSHGPQETLGSLKATWTLTGDPSIQHRHAMLARKGSGYVIHPLEEATVDVSLEPLEASELDRIHDLPFQTLADPTDHHELRHGDILRLGSGTYLYFEYRRLQEATAAARGLLPWVLALSSLLAGTPAWARLPDMQAPHVLVQDVRPLDFPRMEADVLVLDGGEPINGLAPEDFRVQVDEYPVQKATGLSLAASEPGTNYIALVLDRSGSMRFPSGPREKTSRLEAAKAAAHAFVNQMGPQDQAALFSFDQEVQVGTFTRSHEELHAQIDAVEMRNHYSGMTNLLDGVGEACDALKRLGDGDPLARLSVVALTDGAHNVKAEHDEAEIGQVVRAAKIPLYTVGFGAQGKQKAKRGQDFVDVDRMIRLGERESRGHYYPAVNGEELNQAFDRILRAIQGQYRLEFTLPMAEPDDYGHTVTIGLEGLKAETSTDFTNPLPDLPGTWPLRLGINLTVVVLLGGLGFLTGPWSRFIEHAFRPTEKPGSLREVASAVWHEPEGRFAPPRPPRKETNPPPAAEVTTPRPEGSPDAAPGSPRPPRSKVVKSIRPVDPEKQS